MSSTRRTLRFTLGQIMTAIALLGVLFAFVPMKAAMALAFLLTCLLLLERSQLSGARTGPRAEAIGCLACLIGFLVGAILGIIFAHNAPAPGGLPVFATALWCGWFSAISAGMVGRFIAVAISHRRKASPDVGDLHRRHMLAEIDLTEELMAKAATAGDDEVLVKLREYKGKLERELGM